MLNDMILRDITTRYENDVRVLDPFFDGLEDPADLRLYIDAKLHTKARDIEAADLADLQALNFHVLLFLRALERKHDFTHTEVWGDAVASVHSGRRVAERARRLHAGFDLTESFRRDFIAHFNLSRAVKTHPPNDPTFAARHERLAGRQAMRFLISASYDSFLPSGVEGPGWTMPVRDDLPSILAMALRSVCVQ